MFYDMSSEVSAPGWLLSKLDNCSSAEATKIARVLWGVWFLRNKKVWENRVVTAGIAMTWNAKTISDWKEARDKRLVQAVKVSSVRPPVTIKWEKPELGGYKLNVDAAIKLSEFHFRWAL